MFKKWSGKSPACSVINLNTVNLSSSTLKMISTTSSISHVKRPSLLRKSRASGSPNNPLLSHFIHGDSTSGGISPPNHPTLSSSSSSTTTSAVTDTFITSATLQHTSASDLPPVSAFLRKGPAAPLEEIIIWQPETADCEIVEVELGDLSGYLEDKGGAGMDIQEIIVCTKEEEDDYGGGDPIGNYVIQVFQDSPQEEAEEVFSATNVSPGDEDDAVSSLHPSGGLTKQVRKSRSKKLIPAEGDGSFVIDQNVTAPRPKKRKNTVDIKCLEPECELLVHSVHDLRLHLQDEHGMSFHEETIHFESQDQFKRWRTAYEQEHKVSFIYRGGTKQISAEKAVTYLICHRSGIYKPAMTESSERKRKMKPQGSCKIGTHCTAGIKLVKYLTTTEVDATVCHTHYGHDLNNFQHLRLTGAIKEKVLKKFNEGLSFPEVLQYIHHNPDSIDGLRLVDRRAIRNIYDQWRKQDAHIPTVEIEDSGEMEDLSEENLLVEAGIGDHESVDAKAGKDSSGTETESFILSAVSGSSNAQDEAELVGVATRGRKKKAASSRSRRKCTAVDASSTAPAKEENLLESPPASLDSVVARLLEHGESGSGPTVLLYKKAGEPKPEIGDAPKLQSVDSMCLIIQTPIQRQLLEQFSVIVHLELVQGTDMDILVVEVLDEFLMAIPVAWMICNSVKAQLIENFFQILRINCAGIHCDYLFASKKSLLHKLWSKVFSRKPRLLYPQDDVFRELKIFLRKHYDEAISRSNVYDILEKMVLTPDKLQFEEGLKSLKQIAKNPEFLNAFLAQWYESRSNWAFHTRTQIHPALEESFLKLRKFMLFKGTKSLDRNIVDILKIAYDKCFQHDKSFFKGDIKLQAQLDNLHVKHDKSAESCWTIQRVGEGGTKRYKVNEEFEVFDLRTICQCKIRCTACEMCIHQLLCSCGDTQFCVHVHAVKSFIDLNSQLRETDLPNDFDCESSQLTELWIEDVPEVCSNSDSSCSDEEEEPPRASVRECDYDENPPSPSTVNKGSPKRIKKETVGGDEVDGCCEGDKNETSMSSEKATHLISPTIVRTGGAPLTGATPRRISTRLKQRMKVEQSSILGAGNRKRGFKWNQSPPHLEPSSTSPSDFRPEAQVKRKRVKVEAETKEEHEVLRDELLSLISKIELIQDPKLMNQVKKKVSSLSNLLKKNRSSLI